MAEPDEPSVEEQIAASLDAVFGDSDPELVITTASKPPPDLVDVPEWQSSHVQFGGAG